MYYWLRRRCFNLAGGGSNPLVFAWSGFFVCFFVCFVFSPVINCSLCFCPSFAGAGEVLLLCGKSTQKRTQGQGAAPPLRNPTPPTLRPRQDFFAVGNIAAASFRMVGLFRVAYPLVNCDREQCTR